MEETEVEYEIDLDVEFDQSDMVPISNAMDVFYQKEFWFSYSSLKLLLYNPRAFMEKYINNVYEEKLDKHLINGKLIHYLILESGQTESINVEEVLASESFKNMFILSPLDVPTKNNLKLIMNVFKEHRRLQIADEGSNLSLYRDFILAELVKINLHQALVDGKKPGEATGDEKRLAKVLTEQNESYFNFLLIRKSKNILDDKQFLFCVKAAEVILKNKELCDLMGIGANDSTKNTVINEQLYSIKYAGYSFGLKGIIDNLNIDHETRVIHVNDFKTTGKELSEFSEAVEFFNYDIQAVIYLIIIGSIYKDLIYEQKYSVEFHFIVIDKFLNAYPFKVSERSQNFWLQRFDKKIKEADYHYKNAKYDLPYAFAMKEVVL